MDKPSSRVTALNVVFNVTYDLKLLNAITINCISCSFTEKNQIGCLNIIEHSHVHCVRNHMNKKKKNRVLCNSK